MDASYYRRLAHDLMAHAAGTEDPTIAERLRERAREYLMIAEGLEQGDESSKPEDTPERP
jgi:hypothetical protein